MIKYFVFFILTLPVLSQESPDILQEVLMVPFQITGEMDKKREEYIMDAVRSEIERKKIYKVFDKKFAEKLMTDRAGELRGCVGNECSSVLGKAAGTQKVVDGEIVSGSPDTVKIKMINVENGEAEFTDSFEVGKLENLEKDMEPFLNRLSAFSRGIEIPPEVNRWKFVWRSAVLPGWGQWEDGRTGKGIGYGSAFFLLSLNYYIKYANFNAKEKTYRSTLFLPATQEQDTFLLNYVLLSRPKSDYKSAEGEVNTAFYLLSGFYLWNLFDAYYFSAGNIQGAA
ncbi:MAG TPA: hypothetical protein PL048_18910, partial [Leptospiraceae bacterium]|nr:hypothetical protein [Leptospiraceae bacterium]